MRHGGLVWIALSLVLGCGGGGAQTVRARPGGPDVGTPPGGNGNRPASALEDIDAQLETASAISSSPEIPVSGAGFMPQPIVRSGTAGAKGAVSARDGSSLDPSGMAGCIGSFPATAQHQIILAAPIPLLRVLVDSPTNDLTLAVRTPDGVWHCNDDSGDPGNGLNPTVELYAPPPGTIEVWVGTYSPIFPGPTYQLGVTERPGFASDVLRQ